MKWLTMHRADPAGPGEATARRWADNGGVSRLDPPIRLRRSSRRLWPPAEIPP